MTTWFYKVGGGQLAYEYFPDIVRYEAQPAVEFEGLDWGIVYQNTIDAVGWIAIDQGRVYYRSSAPFVAGYTSYMDTSVKVLYDFNLQLGDTAYMDQDEPVLVYQIDTVLLEGGPRRRFSLGNGETWIEGMGSTEGFLRPFLWIYECAYSLSSFCGDYQRVDSTTYHSCWPYLGIEPEVSGPRLSVVSNPAAGTIELRGGIPGQLFQLIDIRGEEVMVGRMTGSPTLIHADGLVSGLYVLRSGEWASRVVLE